jgi:CheY-like chemotaxis protein/HPt (histidine-containing phosphotransfer) domain-containing protein
LLVAEDNALNQEVLEQMLLNAGAQVTLVDNGQLALTALQTSGATFDAVLMDIQMPVMDGYTVTKVIRETLGLTDLPIIALTAHARPQDREKSRLAGMSGHLVKPLDVQALLHAVAKVVGVRSARTHIATTQATTQATSLAQDFSLPGLNVAQALAMFGGSHERYGQLLKKFVAQHGNDVAVAGRYFSEGNAKGATLLMHDIGGVAGLLQAPALCRLASVAESAMLDGKTENLLALFDELQAAMDTVKASVQAFDALIRSSTCP